MDPLELLREDHQRCRQLLGRLASPEAGPALRMHLYAELRRELELHASVEHDIYYPALLADPRNRPLLEAAEDDHAALSDLLLQLDAVPFESPDWTALLARLRDAFEQHIAREEETLFERTPHLLSAGRRHAMALAMLEQRERLVGVRGSVNDLVTPHRGL